MTILPYDRQAEADVIGTMALVTTALLEGIKKLTADDFTQPATTAIFNEMCAMFNEGVAIDETTLASRIDEHLRQPLRDAVGGLTDQARLNYPEYILVLQDRTMRRRIRAAAEDAVRASQEEVSVLAALQTLENHSFALRDSHAGKKRKERFTTEELTDWFRDYLSDEWVDDGEYCFAHALPSLRQQLGPFARGEFGVVAGYSSDGKSVYGLQLAEQACEQGHYVGYYTLEMPERQVYRRLAAMAGVPLRVIKNRDWDNRQRDILRARAREIRGWQLDVWATSVTVEQIRADQMRYGYDMIIIDHLHRMPDSEERLQLERYVRACKTLALDANCAVVALAQLSRRENFPRPSTNQLRGTDVLTQEPDWCVFMYRERDEDGNRLLSGEAIVGKARDGETDGHNPIRLNVGSMRFEDSITYGFTRDENVQVVDSPQTIAEMLKTS